MPPQKSPFALGPDRGQIRLGVQSPDRGGVAQIGNNNVEGGSSALPVAGQPRRERGRGHPPGHYRSRGRGKTPGLALPLAASCGRVWRRLGYKQNLVRLPKFLNFADKETEDQKGFFLRSLNIPVAPFPIGAFIPDPMDDDSFEGSSGARPTTRKKSHGGVSNCSHGKGGI